MLTMAAPAAAQQGQGMFGEQEGAVKVGIQPALPVVQVELFQRVGKRVADAGFVDEGIEAAVPVLRAPDHCAYLVFVADIQCNGPGGGAQARGGLLGFGAVDISQHHLPAILNQPLGDAEPDPARGTGDWRDP